MKTLLKLLFLILFSFLLHLESYAQKEANNWFFGLGAGISFNSNPPQVLTNGQTDGLYGFASMSDANGNLLFYSNGASWIWPFQKTGIYDRRHQKMPNSGNLGGNGGDDYIPLIVPWPGQPQKYFYFHHTYAAPQKFRSYSVIDMSLNGGFGDLSNIQNVRINDYQAKYNVAVQHRNSRDFWVIYLNDSTNIFKSFQISPAGVSTSPIVSNPSFPSGGTAWNAVLKMSPDGKTMAMVRGKSIIGIATTSIELFNFDAANGAVTYKGLLPDSTAQQVEFSPDGTKLYAARYIRTTGTSYLHVELVQYDLDAGTAAAIYNSATIIYTAPTYLNSSTSPNDGTTSMQVGPDGKIYMIVSIVPKVWPHYLSVINRPNLKGKACRFIPNMFNLDPTFSNPNFLMTGYHLPTFVQSYFYRPKITMQQTCFGDTARFALGNPAYVDSVRWNFGDPATGALNKSTSFTPKHFYATAGSYNVQAIVHFNFASDTLNQTIFIPATLLKPNFGPDTTMCSGDTLRLNAYQPGATYDWSDSLTTDPEFIVTKPGTYWVTVSNGCGTRTDTINISLDKPLSINLGADALLCSGQQLQLSVNASAGKILWQDSSTTNTFTVTKPGTYWAEISNACGSWRDSITVNYRKPIAAHWLGKDTIICQNPSYQINGASPNALSYKWQNGSTNSTFTTKASGTFWLEINTVCGTLRDSITITIALPTSRFSDTTICTGDNFTLKAPSGLNYKWSTGDTSQTIIISKAGNYKVEIETAPGCFFTDSLEVKTGHCYKAAYIPNIITPNHDNRNDQFEPKGLEAGQYELSIYNRWGTQIYQNENYTNQWPDKQLSNGTYYYLLRNKQIGKKYKGWVEVVK